jgi:hypothetical protein
LIGSVPGLGGTKEFNQGHVLVRWSRGSKVGYVLVDHGQGGVILATANVPHFGRGLEVGHVVIVVIGAIYVHGRLVFAVVHGVDIPWFPFDARTTSGRIGIVRRLANHGRDRVPVKLFQGARGSICAMVMCACPNVISGTTIRNV